MKANISEKLYSHKDVEDKWQKKWNSLGLYTPDDMTKAREPFYNLWMFPYPSAEGLHAGHAFASTGSDIYGRFMRMRDKTVFQPIGYDSFGIHSENFAIKINQTPQVMLSRTTKHYEDQLRSLGHGYDWKRTVTTSDTDYYHWTQWIFTEMFKAGLAYKKLSTVNWCPGCKTVLADEQIMTPAQAGKIPKGYERLEDVPEGVRVCERCGSIPEKKELSQWFFRITNYAERLLEGLDRIDWSERVKVAQREWIGKKEGINITYPIKEAKEEITCFTTRPDTNFGATFIVVAPEYARDNLLKAVPVSQKKEVEQYIKAALAKSEQQRKEEGRIKTGVFSGLYAINRLNNYEMPIWVSDFVLMGVGTGAVVGVPGHDKRDFEFARKFKIPIKRVVVASDGDKGEVKSIGQVQEDTGTMINSEFLDGMNIHQATKKIMDYLTKKKWGERVTTHHLRDWLISRQRYWGPPIPMIYCDSCAQKDKSWLSQHRPVIQKDYTDWDHAGWYPEDNLPVELPVLKEYKPEGTGAGPLAKHPEFYKVKCPSCKSEARRETDVSDTFVDSSWYFLRYPTVASKNAHKAAFDKEITKKWLPVDLYFGGAEHAVLHLMYARFVTMVLYDLGMLHFEEPFPKFYAHGLMIKDGAKMSKSRGNVVNPDEYVEKYGADTLRLYLMFMGPMDGYPDFRDTGIEGMQRFVRRVWDTITKIDKTHKAEKEVTTRMHQTIKKVTEDIEIFQYNTAIASLMEYVNAIREAKNYALEYIRTLVQLIAPFAPHLAEEAWVEILGEEPSVHTSLWPNYDVSNLLRSSQTIAIQIDGKFRSQLDVDIHVNKEQVLTLAKKDPKVEKWLTGQKINNVIYVPGKLLNFVTS